MEKSLSVATTLLANVFEKQCGWSRRSSGKIQVRPTIHVKEEKAFLLRVAGRGGKCV